MDTNTAASIAMDVILQKEGRNYFTLNDGSALMTGKAKGHNHAVFVKVMVTPATVLLDVWPVEGGRMFVWDISTSEATEERLKECSQDTLEGVIRLNKWDEPSRV